MRKIAALVIASTAIASAATEWTRIATPDFEMYTTAGEKRGREAILYFEQVRSFFRTVSSIKADSQFPIRIIAFKSEKEFRPYAPPNGFVSAYYTASQSRDYIVMRDLEPSSFPVAIHEYMHLLVRHSGLKFPLWLNEGWADVYSTLKPMAGKTMVGDLMPGRVQTLQSQKWLDFETLTSVRQDSPTYNEKDRAGIFYAESWALTHMLYLSPEYTNKFPQFLAAISSGKAAAEACEIAFGRTSAQVYRDLQSYLKRNALYGAMFDAKFEKTATDVAARAVAEPETSLTSADLMAAIRHRDEAKAAYEKILSQFPGNPEVTRSLGYLAWGTNDREMARKYFRQAFDGGEKDAQMCYHLALLERDNNGSLEEIAAPLRRALTQKPNYTDARMELGFAFMRAEQYDGAIAALRQVRGVDPERAAPVFNALAYAWMKNGDMAEARKQAEQAIKWAKDESQTRQAKDLLSYMNGRAAAEKARHDRASARVEGANPPELREVTELPTAPRSPNEEPLGRPFGEGNPFVRPEETVVRVEGMAKELACVDKGAILRIATSTGIVSLDMPEPDHVLLKHEGGATFEFTCGPQKEFRVAAEYVPGPDAKRGTVGTLRLLEF